MNLNEEKEKARYAHSLEIRKLIIDRLAIGVVIVVLGVLGNYAVERYRRDSIAQQFLLEQKIEALKSIWSAYAEAYDALDTCTIESDANPSPKGPCKNLAGAVDKYARATTEFSALLSAEFSQNLDYHLWILQAFRFSDVAEAKAYRNFIYDLC